MNPDVAAFQAVIRFLFAQRGEESVKQILELAKANFDGICNALAQKTGQEPEKVMAVLRTALEVEYTTLSAWCEVVEAELKTDAGATIPAFLASTSAPTPTQTQIAPPTADQIANIKALIRAGADADEAFRVILGRNQDGSEWIPTGKPREWSEARKLAYGMTLVSQMKAEKPEGLKWLNIWHDKTKTTIFRTAGEAESVQDWRERLIRQYAGAIRARQANETMIMVGAQWGFNIDSHTIATAKEEEEEEGNGDTTVVGAPDFLRRS